MELLPNVEGSAVFSECGRYRYVLTRTWSDLPDVARTLVVVGLNPSTATELVDDPTLRRCQHFARREGFVRLYMLNLFAFRATDPRELKRCEPHARVGADNDEVLRGFLNSGSKVVAAWGDAKWPFVLHRAGTVVRMADRFWCLGRTKGGAPRHPLYVRGDTPLELLQEKSPP